MRIRLDPWPVDTLDGQLSLKPFQGQVTDVETSNWAALPAKAIPERLHTVYVVDGKPRMEARLLIEQDGVRAFAGYGAYVVGAVNLCPHGSRPAELLGVRARRLLAYSGDFTLQAARMSPRNPHSGQLEYTPLHFDTPHPDGAKQAVQRAMLAGEQQFAQEMASGVPESEFDERSPLETLIVQDGPVRPGTADRAVVGCVKTLHTDYLGPDRAELLGRLRPGERTPIVRYDSQVGSLSRFTWYVRLADAPFYLHPLAGVMRLEMRAPEDEDFLPPNVRRVAELSGTLLTRLASKEHKDSRAPQNLIPVGALEQAMSRAMGSAELVTRRIRAHLAQELGLDRVGGGSEGAVA